MDGAIDPLNRLAVRHRTDSERVERLLQIASRDAVLQRALLEALAHVDAAQPRGDEP